MQIPIWIILFCNLLEKFNGLQERFDTTENDVFSKYDNVVIVQNLQEMLHEDPIELAKYLVQGLGETANQVSIDSLVNITSKNGYVIFLTSQH